MATAKQVLIDLEKSFWQSMVDQDTSTATRLLAEPALMVSSHGTMKFDHAGYREMAEQGSMTVTSFELSDAEVLFPTDTLAIVTYRVKQGVAQRGKQDSVMQKMNDTSTWVLDGARWKCVMHTETPVAKGS